MKKTSICMLYFFSLLYKTVLVGAWKKNSKK